MNINVKSSRRTHGQRGQALVETALTIPLLLFLLMGMIDLGRFINRFFIVSRVSYEAARYAASLAEFEMRSNAYLEPNTATVQGQVRVRVTQMLEHQGIDAADREGREYHVVNITPDSAHNAINIMITVPFEPLFPLFRGVMTGGFATVRAQAQAPYLFAGQSLETYIRSQ